MRFHRSTTRACGVHSPTRSPTRSRSRAEYAEASTWLKRLSDDIDAFDLEFAKPHAQWVTALIRLGTRRFGEAERLLQTLEDANVARREPHQTVNARLLRARLLLQTGKAADAEQLTS